MNSPYRAADVTAFWLPKKGYREEDYEDAHAEDPVAGFFAIADGATTSPCAGEWARLLVREFVSTRVQSVNDWTERLALLQESVEKKIRDREEKQWGRDPKDRPWWADYQCETTGPDAGARAAFLGLYFDDDGWGAMAVGDSCLFQVRDGVLKTAFPIGSADKFPIAPDLIDTRSKLACLLSGFVSIVGQWQCGDRFWLMTDALARWFVQQYEKEQRPWDGLEDLLPSSSKRKQFAQWIGELREIGELSNDDVTLIAVRL